MNFKLILLIGNFLSSHGLNPTAIEDLANTLSTHFEVKTSSSKLHPIYRMADMASTILKYRKKCSLIIVDVFSTNAFGFAVLVIMLAKIFDIKYMPVFRGGYLEKKYNRYPSIFNYLFKSSAVNICPSPFFMEKFNKAPFKLQLIPNYIDFKIFKFFKREHFTPKLLWVRSIHAIYNPMMAIDVLSQLSPSYPHAELCMIGPVKDELLMKRLQEKIRLLKLDNRVLFKGQLSKKEWAKISRKYDIFINTSNIDNTPISLLEAMALGLPVVSTNVGGISYIVEEKINGLLVNPDDNIKMGEKVKNIINDKELGGLISDQAYNYVSKLDKEKIRLSWIKSIEST